MCSTQRGYMSYRIYKCTDKIEIKIEDISIFISPLSYQQKMNINDLLQKASMQDTKSAMEVVIATFKASIKGVKGLVDADGLEYVCKFDGDELSMSTIDDLLNLPISNKISAVCSSLLYGIPKDKIVDSNGNIIEGVSLILKDNGKKEGN